MRYYLHINHLSKDIRYTLCEEIKDSEYSKIIYTTSSKEQIKIYLTTIGFNFKRYEIYKGGYFARVYNK